MCVCVLLSFSGCGKQFMICIFEEITFMFVLVLIIKVILAAVLVACLHTHGNMAAQLVSCWRRLNFDSQRLYLLTL